MKRRQYTQRRAAAQQQHTASYREVVERHAHTRVAFFGPHLATAITLHLIENAERRASAPSRAFEVSVLHALGRAQ
jgi:hypothetical protein